MGYGLGIALIVVGLILAFAVHASLGSIDIQTIGLILAAAGVLVLAITALQLNSRRRSTTVATTTDSEGRQATTERRSEGNPPVV